MPVGGYYRQKRGRIYRINTRFPELGLFKRTMMYTLLIRRINESDVELTPAEQADIIKKMDGLQAEEMESLIPLSGPRLASEIRNLISPHRATNRTYKDKYD